MTRTFDISNKLPKDIVHVLSTLDEFFSQMGVRYLLIGALARDVVTAYVQGTVPQRATKDVDLAICVDSMEDFTRKTSEFESSKRAGHKFHVAGLEVDLVPFFDDVRLNSVEFDGAVLDVSGLFEADVMADTVVVNEQLEVRTASVGALCLLKIFAWRDRHTWTNKDAIDLQYLFNAVTSRPYLDEVWADEKISERVEYDGSLIGAAWLGHEAGRIALPQSRKAALDVLEQCHDEICADMGGLPDLAAEQLDAFTRALRDAPSAENSLHGSNQTF